MKKWLFGIFCLLIASLAIGAWLLATTQSGLRLLVRTAQPGLAQQHIQLDTQAISGTLFHFQIRNIILKGPYAIITLKKVKLHWDPWQLFNHQIHLYHGSIGHATIAIGNTHIQSAPQSSNKTKTYLRINQFEIQKLTIITPTHRELQFGQLRLKQAWLQAHRLHLSNLSLHGPHLQLTGDGDIALAPPYPFHVNAQLFSHYQKTTGQLNIKGHGAAKQFSLKATGAWRNQLESLATLDIAVIGNTQVWKTQRFDVQIGKHPLLGHAVIHWQPTPTWNIHLNGQKLNLHIIDPYLPAPFSITLHSSMQQRKGLQQLQMTTPSFAIKAQVHTQHHQQTWRNTIQQLQLTTPVGPWHLLKPATLIRIPAQWQLANLCLIQHHNRLCGHFAKTANQWQLGLNSNLMQLSGIPSGLESLDIATKTQWHIDFQQQKNQADSGHAQIVVRQLNLYPKPNSLLPKQAQYRNQLIQQGQLTLKLQQQQLDGQLHLTLSPGNTIDTQAKLTALQHFTPTANSRIQGKLNVDIADIHTLNPLVPEYSHLHGQLLGNLSVNSPWSAPKLLGEWSLNHASTDIPPLGTHYSNIQFHLISHKPGDFHLSGSIHTKNGYLSINGTSKAQGKSPIIHAHITGKNFLLISLPALTMVASPDLTYQQNHQLKRLTGRIDVPSADIDADLMRKQAQASSDVIFVNRDNKPIHPLFDLPFESQIRLILGKKIIFSGFGVTTHIKGQLHIHTDPKTGAKASGLLRLIGGHYSGYGKQFSVTQGALIFDNSPITNPRLDITAYYHLVMNPETTYLNKIQIGVRINGTLTNPNITLFSNPAMSHTDILSYIILGESYSKAQQDSGNGPFSHAAAAIVLDTSQTSLVTEIEKKLGLNQLSVGTLDERYGPESGDLTSKDETSSDNTALFIGKPLTKRLSMSYGIGFFNAEQQVALKYQLTPRWQLRTNASTMGEGADVLYIINVD